MNSALYFGRVQHRRWTPVRHAFSYSVFQVYLDLAELDDVFRGRWLWSTRRPSLAWFRRADHMGDPSVPLDTAVRDFVEASGVPRPRGPIRLLTHLRYFGYVMNPVSFYYCFDPADDQVETIVAEVNNTPWGERHCYVLAGSSGPIRTFRLQKQFHVSPFMAMTPFYDWRLTDPGDRVTVHMTTREGRHPIFDATLALSRRPISGGQLALALLKYPFMTLQVIAGIYWQAFRLWRKGAPYHLHPRYAQTPGSPAAVSEEPR